MTKKRYTVKVFEVHCQDYSVEAESPEQALELANAESSNTDNIELEYCHTLPQEQWDVFEEENEEYKRVVVRRAEELEQGDYSGLISYQEGLDFADMVLGSYSEVEDREGEE